MRSTLSVSTTKSLDMAIKSKRKVAEDDFIRTISDGEADDDTNHINKRAKLSKKTSLNGAMDSSSTMEGMEIPWDQENEENGAMDSDFEFTLLENGAVLDDVSSWGFETVRKLVPSGGGGLNLDDIIRRRRDGDADIPNGLDTGEHDHQGSGSGLNDDGVRPSDAESDDDDAFGADEVDGYNGLDDEDGDGDGEGGWEASDDDSVATPVAHPDDSDSSSDHEDPEEEAKVRAFFAAGEKHKASSAASQGTATSFQDMSLSRPILRGLTAVGFSSPTPIQAKTIPIALLGRDVVGGAVTGSGKTAAFVVPITERLLFRPKKVPTSRVVILTPTRELAIQCHSMATKLAAYTDIKFTLAVGGLSLKSQEAELRLRPDVIIATPGRFIDHMRNSASFSVDAVEILVLDEADRMLEDGFSDELNEILTTLPRSRQTMLFSATMTSSVDQLIRVGLDKPVRLMVDSKGKLVGTLVQEFVRLRPGREDKRMGYLVHLCKNVYTERTIIFFRQKQEAHHVRAIFGLLGLSSADLHGSLSQAQRIESVEAFRDGKVAFLLATDLASRGLDIKGVDTVINYQAPATLEVYVHRVGRTARGGRGGTSCTITVEADRKVIKAVVKAGRAQGAKMVSRVVEASDADLWQGKVDDLAEEVEAVLLEEKQEKALAQAEMQVRKGENLMEHEAEIKSRPRRTWFEHGKAKTQTRQSGRQASSSSAAGTGAQAGGTERLRDALKKRHAGRLSNKDKKKLDSRTEQNEGKLWRKGAAERATTEKGAAGKPEAKVKGKAKGTAKGTAKGAAKGKTNVTSRTATGPRVKKLGGSKMKNNKGGPKGTKRTGGGKGKGKGKKMR